MALNLDKIKSRLTTLSSKSPEGRSKLIWKPAPGQQTIRIVPYFKNPDNPFIELKFHYKMGAEEKTYLSPDTFNRPDPIVEFSNKLKSTGDKEEWKMGRKFEPKLRTFAPVIVRGEEEEGVKFWGFGKQVYEAILSVIADPDYGDITDLGNGRDIVVEFKTAKELKKDFPATTIRVKPNQTPAVDPTKADLIQKIKNQSDIMELFPEPTYDELKSVMDAWLHPEESEDSGGVKVDKTEQADAPVEAGTEKAPSATAGEAKANAEDITKAFDNLFGNK
jgi:hypothetical protein